MCYSHIAVCTVPSVNIPLSTDLSPSYIQCISFISTVTYRVQTL